MLDTNFALEYLEVERGTVSELEQLLGYKTKLCTQEKEDMLLFS